MSHIRNPKCQDFEYLCRAADSAGWQVGISVGGYIEKPREDKVGRRTLGAIRLRPSSPDPKRPKKISVLIEDNLALASRVALERLVAEAGAK